MDQNALQCDHISRAIHLHLACLGELFEEHLNNWSTLLLCLQRHYSPQHDRAPPRRLHRPIYGIDNITTHLKKPSTAQAEERVSCSESQETERLQQGFRDNLGSGCTQPLELWITSMYMY